MTPIILTPKKVPILHSELTPKNGVTVTLYFLQYMADSPAHITHGCRLKAAGE